jgi:hypothetical protein
MGREVHTGSWWENLSETDYLKDQGVDGKGNIKNEYSAIGMDWIDLAQARDRWRALVNAVMNLRFEFHKMRGIC